MTLLYVKRDGAGHITSAQPRSDDLHTELVEDPELWVSPASLAYSQMSALESTRTERRKRDARMGAEGAQQWLDALDVQIEALRPA